MSKGRYFFGSIEVIDIARVTCSSTEVIELFCVIHSVAMSIRVKFRAQQVILFGVASTLLRAARDVLYYSACCGNLNE